MPPKGSAKKAVPATPKVAVPVTPKGESGDEDQAPDTPVPGSKVKTPRKPKAPPKVFHKLPTSISSAAPVDVTYENDTVLSTPLLKGGGYGQMVKLVAPQPFELVASYMLDNGLQAVIIKPSSPFPFMKLPKSVRKQIMEIILSPPPCGKDGKFKNRIEITADKSGNAKAKDYAQQFKLKNRVAIAYLNKESAAEARMILYGYKLKFDSTSSLLNLLSQAGDDVRKAMTRVIIGSFGKSTVMPCFNMLADCPNMQNIHILAGVGVSSNPIKAAKAFYTEAGRLLQAIAHHHKDKNAALNVVTFGNGCFSIKEEDELVEWDSDQVEEFRDLILSKLK